MASQVTETVWQHGFQCHSLENLKAVWLKATNCTQSLSISDHLLLGSLTDISHDLLTNYPRYGDIVRDDELCDQYHISTNPIGYPCRNTLTQGFPDTCRLAVMTLGKPNGYAVNSLWGSNWKTILIEMQKLFVCGSPQSGTVPSGGYMALNSM